MSGTGPAPTAPPTPPTNTTSPPPSATSPPPAASLPPAPPVQAPPPATSPPPLATTPPPAASVSPPPPSTPPPTSTPATPPPVTPTTPPPLGSPPSPPSTTPSPPSRNPPPSTPTGGNSPPLPPTSGNSPPGTGRPLAPLPPPESSSSGVSKGVVVGIAIGGVVTVVILVVLGLLFICFRKKKRKNHGRIDYYPPPPPLGVKADPYGGNVQHWQHNAPPPADHVISIPPKLSHPPGGAASRPPHPPARAPSPQLPPSYMSSSGANSSSYSGSENPLPPPSPGMALGSFSKSTFTYDELVLATGGFTNANLLGQGGFGYVHKGILPTGKEVAVKQLKAGSGQGEREFQAEVDIISRVHHKHLVSLVGYCVTGAQRMLVYEFVPNNTLEFHLHANGRPPLDWPTRLKIALGSAKGLAYLHEDCQPKIIHRDIKAANILLDFNFETKVADFGLAKITSDINTHVSTRVMGTFGYLAPEYASSGKLSEKSDVYSFGVMLLELITGRRPVDSTHSFNDDSLVDWARPLLTRALDDEKFDTLVDPRLENEYSHNEMTRMVACAAACVRHSARRRPRMSQVVRALEGDVSLSDLNEGIRPGHSTVYSSYGSSDYDASQYNEDKKNFWKMMELTNEEISSSDQYNNPTSEHGSNPSGSSSEGQQSREMETNNQTKRYSGGIGESKGFTGIS